MNMQKVIGILLGSAVAASAHLNALTMPRAGETYAPGATVNVRWGIGSAHDTQDLSYSINGGTSWISIATGLARNVAAYTWTVPATPSTTVRFRVCQRDGGGGCTDAHNTQALTSGIRLPAGGEVYTAITGNFTISASSGLGEAEAGMPGARVRMNTASRSVDVAFAMEKAGKVRLEAFDAQGKRIATLVDENRAEGFHEFSVFSNALDVTRTAVFRLQAGTQVIRHSAQTVR